jgi:UDP-N-acetyl-2-amino-2-deoxyglucuronate dehydrogenase
MNAPRRSTPVLRGRPARIAIVGCGRIAGRHLDAIAHHHAGAQLVALCDPNPAALARTAAAPATPRFASLESMIDALRGEVDLVVLATPSGLHAPQAITAARAGLHVLCEKPMATRWNDGLGVVRAVESAGTRLFVVKQNRLNPPLVALKRAIDQGRFGRIAMVAVNVFWSRPQQYYDAAPWRGTWALDGGAFMNQASHYVDMSTGWPARWRWCTPSPQRSRAASRSRTPA